MSNLLTRGAEENPIAIPAVGHAALRVLSPTLLELELVTTKQPDPAPVTTWNFIGANFAATLPAASEFSVTVGDSPVAVARVGFKRRPLYAPLKHRDLRIGNFIYLQLASPVIEGQEVVVRNPSGALWNGANVSFECAADPARFSPAIHVNQVGYIPNFTKKAMVGYYLGSLGELAVSARTFNILDAATHQVRFTGSLAPRKDTGYTYSPLPYQNVYEADFTAFNSAGEYVLQVPGMGVSYPFSINPGTAAAFARTLALGLYHQRCGGPNELPITRFEHDACHIAPAAVPDSTYTTVNQVLANMSSDYSSNPLHTAPQLKDVNSSLYPFINKGPVDVRGGHHDAGDYSKYTINSAALVHHLVFAADAFPGVAALDNLGIPESGDGRSDMLQEAKWEADFLAKMQDADGGFYFLVYPRDREYEDDVLPDHGDPQVVFPKTTAVTAAAVGALAEIASSPTFRAQFPAEAAAYLQKAKSGWSFLTNAIARYGKNGSYQKITHYGNEFMHDDELAWAAAALFVATGDTAFQDQLKAWYDPSNPNTRRWTWWRLFEGYGCATRAYAFAARSGRLPASALDPVYLAKCEAEIVAAGDDIARFAQESAYGTSFPDPNKSFRTAGWFFSSERAFELAVAQQIKPAAGYIDAIVSNMNYEGGCNPVNVAYITGIGWHRWTDIVHQYAQNDMRVLPPTGLPLGNIQGGFAYLENYKVELGQLCYPPDGAASAPYPFYDRWGDSFNTTTEFVVVDQARALSTLAFLMAKSGYSAPYTRVASSIGGISGSIAAEQEITLSFNAPGEDLAGAQIVWEARDQQPAFGRTFTFAPVNPGEQWVEVEAMLPDGRRLISKTNFTATSSENVEANADQSIPLSAGAGIAALYHLDGSLADATGKNPALALVGNATLDANNLGWMASRSGQALRVNDLGDAARVTVNPGYLAGTTTAITVEAMVYVNAYKAWNRASARLLSLEKSWNASLKWSEDMYTGPHAGGGTMFDFSGDALAAAMPVHAWHHLALTISQTGYALKVNGVTVKSVASSELANWNGGSAVLEFGNFDGWIDEVAVRNDGAVIPSVPVQNQIPSVTFTKPTANTSIAATTALTLEAAASDSDGSIQKVEYYLGTSKIGESLKSPFTVLMNASLPGLYTVSAVATDNTGARSPAANVSFNILAPAPGPASNFRANATATNAIQLNWSASSGGQTGYRIYRSLDGLNYSLRATIAATGLSWTDSGLAAATRYFYRLAAFNGSGESAQLSAAAQTLSMLPAAPVNVQGVGQTQSILISWNPVPGATGYLVKRASAPTGPFYDAGSVTSSVSLQDFRIVKGLTYYYYVIAQSGSLSSPASAMIAARLDSATANIQFVGVNSARTGTWKGSIGKQGYVIAGENRMIPSYAQFSFSGSLDWIWQYTTSDLRAVQRSADATRLAACWYSSTAFDISVNCTDGAFHRLTLHCLDWDRQNRNQAIEISDAVTGTFLHSCRVANFGEGAQVEYLVQGSVKIRVKNLSKPNAVLSGIFLDAAN